MPRHFYSATSRPKYKKQWKRVGETHGSWRWLRQKQERWYGTGKQGRAMGWCTLLQWVRAEGKGIRGKQREEDDDDEEEEEAGAGHLLPQESSSETAPPTLPRDFV
ncbi:hypothetical protein GW17_00002393 [Ensete ventricosum]|nr:hypothetical protein GW17_00002393 [Ensete ventricosum]